MNAKFAKLSLVGLLALPLGGCPWFWNAVEKQAQADVETQLVCNSLPTTDDRLRRIDRDGLLDAIRAALNLDDSYWPKLAPTLPPELNSVSDLRRELRRYWREVPDAQKARYERIERSIEDIDRNVKDIRTALTAMVDEGRALARLGSTIPKRDPSSRVTTHEQIETLWSRLDRQTTNHLLAESRRTGRPLAMRAPLDASANPEQRWQFAIENFVLETKAGMRVSAEMQDRWASHHVAWSIVRTYYILVNSAREIEESVQDVFKDVQRIKNDLDDLVKGLPTGPIKDKLAELGALLDGMENAWQKLQDDLKDAIEKPFTFDKLVELARAQDAFLQAMIQREAGRISMQLLHRQARVVQEALDKLSEQEIFGISLAGFLASELIRSAIAGTLGEILPKLVEFEKLGDSVVFGMTIAACQRLRVNQDTTVSASFRADTLLEPFYQGIIRVHYCKDEPANTKDKCLSGEAFGRLDRKNPQGAADLATKVQRRAQAVIESTQNSAVVARTRTTDGKTPAEGRPSISNIFK